MAHEIDQTTGRAAVLTTGLVPWHRLGITVENAVNSREAIELAGLNWQVQQWPVYATQEQHAVQAHRHVANVRTDTNAVLGIVGKDYKVFQNREAFDFMDALVGDKLAMYETAGALKDGRLVWMLARIPKQYRAGSEDLIQPYVLLVNSHDGSTSLKMIPTTVRVVCANTLNLTLQSHRDKRTGIAIRHHQNLDERVREARERLGVVAARFDKFDEELHQMIQRELRPREVDTYFRDLMPPKPEETQRQKHQRHDTMRQFQANFENDTNTLPGMRHTAWAAYNAVSEWADHQRNFRGRDETVRAENRLNSVWFGASHDLKQKAYRNALALTAN